MNNVNLQLYSFGFDTPYSPLETIQKAGEMGYAGVEFIRNYEDIPAEDMQKALKDAGVTADSAHVGLEFIEQDIPYLHEVGVKFVVCPSAPFATAEEARELAADLNRLGQVAKPYGMMVGYHNHTQEFTEEDGKYLLEYVIENTDPETVAFEIDCGWASAAGIDPVAFINKHAGRIAGIHIKENGGVIGPDKPQSRHVKQEMPKLELDENGKPIFPPEFLRMMEERNKLNVPTGSGIVDWKAVKAAADAQRDNVIFVVEREASYGGKERTECLKEDVAWLKANI